MNTDKITAERIAEEYAVKEKKEDSLVALDKKVKKPVFIFSLSFGIVSTLLLGTGMSLSMRVIGDGYLGSILLGLGLGILGIIGMSINYPIHKKILDQRKKKYAPEILNKAEAILNDGKEERK